MVDASEIEEEYAVDGVYVKGPEGMVRVTRAYRTVPMKVWRLVAGGYGIECSHKHLVGTPVGFIEACALRPGDTVLVNGGEAVVEESNDTGREECLYDITVDTPSGAFYSNGILSHNSTSFCARQLALSCVLPGYRSLYVTPYFEQLSTYGERMFDMEGLVRYDAGTQNKYLKKYPNGSKIWMSYACESADQIRGKTVSECLIDECVSEDTIIICRRTEKSVDREVRICDAVVGDLVMCPTETNEISYGRITSKCCKGERSCWTLRTQKGYHVTATANHKFRSGERWVYVADILRDFGVQRIDERVQGEEHGHNESVYGRASHTCHDFGHHARGWQYSEPGEVRVRQEDSHRSRGGSERVRSGEDADAECPATFMVHRSEQGIWERVQYLSFCNYDIPGYRAVLEPVLQQAGSFTGWSGADAEVCISGLGGPADLGGSGLVDSGRRMLGKRCVQDLHNVLFGGRGESVGSLVQESGVEASWRSTEEGYSQRGNWKGLPDDSVFSGCLVQDGWENSAVRASLYGVQIGSHVTVYGMCMPGLRGYVPGDQAEIRSDEILQCDTLPGMCEEGEEECQSALQGACRFDGDATSMARGKETRGGEAASGESGEVGGAPREKQGALPAKQGAAQGVQQEILPGAQGGDLCEGAGEVSREGRIETLWVLHDGKIIEDKIVSVAYAGRRRVWDITVEPSHTFFSNSVIGSNCQNMNPMLLPEILKTQQMSKFPMTIYSGTALDTETLLEQRWQMSSKGCFHVRSHDGKHWINLHDEEELWKVCSNPMHPIDYWTGKPLDVTNGVFVHENGQALERGDVGLHIPMILVPSNCSGTQWAQIYDDIANQNIPRKKVLQEVFGIAVGEGAREVTEEDLKAICVLTDNKQTVLHKIRTGKYRTVVMGCDWGGSDYNRATKTKQSYTSLVILGLTFADKVEILWAKKYAGMEYRTIAGDFFKYYKEFGCRAIASDYGGSAVYTLLIRDHIPWQRHYIMQYDAPWCAPFKAANSDLANHYTVNRTEAVTNTFMDIKEGRLQAGPWTEMRPFLTDILAVRRVISEQPSGKKYMLWQRDNTKPDDFLHALTFGLTLIKVYLGERVVSDLSVLAQVRGIMNGQPAPVGLHTMPPVISG